MRLNLNNPTDHDAAEWAGTLAAAYDAAETIACDPTIRCPDCDAILNLDIWEFGDGTGQMMEVCECGFTRSDANRIVITHEVNKSPGGPAAWLFDQPAIVDPDLPGDYG